MLQKIFAIALCFGCLSWTYGQGPTSLPAKHIPEDADLLITVRPTAIMALPEFELLPVEILSAVFEESFGIGLDQIARMDLVMQSSTGMIAVVVETAAPVQDSDIDYQPFVEAEWQSEDGLKVLYPKQMRGMVIARQDDRHFVFGVPGFVKLVMDGENNAGPLVEIASKMKGGPPASLIFSLEPSRDFYKAALDQMANFGMPPVLINSLNTIVERSNHVAARWTSGENPKIQGLIAADQGYSVDEIEDSLTDILVFIEQQLHQFAGMTVQMEPELAEPIENYLARLHDAHEKLLTPRKSNNRLLVEIPLDDPLVYSTIAAFSSIGFPIGGRVQMVAGAAPMAGVPLDAAAFDSSVQSLREIGLSFHNHESAYKHLPKPAIVDEDGKPLLSWRVAVLPFLGQSQLYQQFHLDEPWDSPHNKELIDKMPAVFSTPDVATEPGHTAILAVVGPQFAFEEEAELNFGQFLDGTSNTAWLVLVDAEHSVPWTAPQDFNPDVDDVLKGLYLDEARQAHCIAFADGSVQWLSTDLGEVFWALFTRNGAEVVNIR